MNILKKLRLDRIISVFFLVAVLFMTTAYNSGEQLNANNLSSNTLLAVANKSETTYPTDDNQVEGLLYSNKDQVKSLDSVDDFVSPQRQKALKDPSQIPAVKQPVVNRSDPDSQLLEKTRQMFDDAADF